MRRLANFFCTRLSALTLALGLALFQPAMASEAGKTAFTDVPAGAYYEDAVAWAADQGITLGTTDTTFAPLATCSRGNVVTFLWRWAGKPEPHAAKTFSDVAEDSYCASAVRWAVEKNVTLGTTETTFSPNALCSYGHILTFLWRFLGSPASQGTGTLAGQYPGRYYQTAVEWAEEQGLLVDCLEGFFPTAPCPRGDVVQFLYLTRLVSAEECLANYRKAALMDKDGNPASLTASDVVWAELMTYGAWNDHPDRGGRMLNMTEEQSSRLVWVVRADTSLSLGGMMGPPLENVTALLVFDARTGTLVEEGFRAGEVRNN